MRRGQAVAGWGAGRLVVFGLGVGLALLSGGFPPADGAGAPAHGQSPGDVAAAWVVLGPNGAAAARAVTRRTACPNLDVAGASLAMAVRVAPTPPEWPLLVCEASLPPGAPGGAVGGQPLPAVPSEPRRVVVIGDAGCRVEEGDPVQDCNDPSAWPFARVARSAAAWQPDLVLHVGDYIYRESPCPPKVDGCAGNPWGDTWATWQADLLTPAAPLLRAAPWVFVRGNHELCRRGGPGWVRLLDPRPFAGACADYTDPYVVTLGDLQIVVVDTSAADDRTTHPEQVALYAAQYATARDLAGPNTWLAQHRPLWAIGQDWRQPGPSGTFRTNPTLQAASDNRLPAGVQLVLSGHVHLWEALSFADGRPPQVVVGNSGTSLDPALSVPPHGLDIAGTTVAAGSVQHRFGFMTLERGEAGWVGTLRDVDGAPIVACAFVERRAACAP